MESLHEAKDGRTFNVGSKVRCYLNWNKRLLGGKPTKSCFSIMDMDPRSETYQKVVGYTEHVTLKDVSFKVSEAGRQRVLNEECKNVHAYVTGILISLDTADIDDCRMVYYDPYKVSQFIDLETQEKIESAALAHLCNRRVWIPKSQDQPEDGQQSLAFVC